MKDAILKPVIIRSSLFVSNCVAIIIRASVFNPNFISRNVITQTYFVNEVLDSREMPVFSISTSPEYFWDEDTGLHL